MPETGRTGEAEPRTADEILLRDRIAGPGAGPDTPARFSSPLDRITGPSR